MRGFYFQQYGPGISWVSYKSSSNASDNPGTYTPGEVVVEECAYPYQLE